MVILTPMCLGNRRERDTVVRVEREWNVCRIVAVFGEPEKGDSLSVFVPWVIAANRDASE